MTGSETDVCVLPTVPDALDVGYRVVVIKDGLCSSFDAAHEAPLHLYAKRLRHRDRVRQNGRRAGDVAALAAMRRTAPEERRSLTRV
ncbi:isochorismatase family protein [Bradyrhizobium ottawaense]